MHRDISNITNYDLTDSHHEGTVQQNVPLKWELDGRDGRYMLKLSGGDAQSRAMAMDAAFARMGKFHDVFEHQICKPRDGSSPYKLSATDMRDGPLEGTITLIYANAMGAGDAHTRQMMRRYVESCMVTGADKGLGA